MILRFLVALLTFAAPVMAQSPGNLPMSMSYAPTGSGGTVPSNLCLESGGADCTFTGVPLLVDGTAALPGLAFASEPGSGLRLAAPATLGLSTGGVDRVQIGTVSVLSTLAWSGPNGTVALPAFRFTGDPNTGIRWAGGDQMALVAGGADRLNVSTTSVGTTVPVAGPTGVASAPAHTFVGDLDTGLSNTSGYLEMGVDGGSATGAAFIGINQTSKIISFNNGNAGQGMVFNNSGGLQLNGPNAGLAVINGGANLGFGGGVNVSLAAFNPNTTPGFDSGVIAGSTANLGAITGVRMLQFKHNCTTNDCTSGTLIGDVRTVSAGGVQYRGTFFTGGALDFSDTTFNPHRGTAPAALPTCSTTTVGIRYKEDTDTAGTAPALCLCSRDNAALTYSWKVLNGGGTC